MAELTFVAYVLSLISIVLNIWLAFEVREMKKERNELWNQLRKRLSVPKPTQQSKPKSYWG